MGELGVSRGLGLDPGEGEEDSGEDPDGDGEDHGVDQQFNQSIAAFVVGVIHDDLLIGIYWATLAGCLGRGNKNPALMRRVGQTLIQIKKYLY